MFIGRILDLVIVAVLFALLVDSKPAAPLTSRSLVYSQPGVVEVYLRPGDTPLQDINADLAEAFDFNAAKHGRLAFGRQINEILDEKEKNGDISLSSIELGEGESYTLKKKQIGTKNSQSVEDSKNTHIQRIPKH